MIVYRSHQEYLIESLKDPEEALAYFKEIKRNDKMFRYIEFFEHNISMGYITLEGIAWFDIERRLDYARNEFFVVKAGGEEDDMPRDGYHVSEEFTCEKKAHDFLNILMKRINGE